MKNKIVVYGGSFNPPLNSHFIIAQQVLNQFDEVKKVIFLPVNNNYAKDGLIENKHRYNMLKIVIDQNEKFELSDMDLNAKRSLHTIETLDKVQKMFPNEEICFLCGSDNLKELNTWKSAEKLISKYKIIVMERDTDQINDIIKNDKLLSRYRKNIVKLKEDVKSNYKSSYVREQLKKGKSVRYLLPDKIFYYIEENNVYKSWYHSNKTPMT